MEEYEPEEVNEWCVNCEFYSHDTWYQGEYECTNDDSVRCGETIGQYDTCDWWERRRE